MKKIIVPIALFISTLNFAQNKCQQFKSFTDLSDMLELNAKCDISLNEKYNNYRYIFEKNVEYELSKQLPSLNKNQLENITAEFLGSLDLKKFSKKEQLANTKKLVRFHKIYNKNGMYPHLKEFYGLSSNFSFKAKQLDDRNFSITYYDTIYSDSLKTFNIEL